LLNGLPASNNHETRVFLKSSLSRRGRAVILVFSPEEPRDNISRVPILEGFFVLVLDLG
jgi:hypothetical protein